MHKFSNQLLSAAALATVLISGCGGQNNDVTTAPNPAANIDMSVSALVTYLNGLISGTSESADPVDVNPLTLAVDDTAEPTELN